MLAPPIAALVLAGAAAILFAVSYSACGSMAASPVKDAGSADVMDVISRLPDAAPSAAGDGPDADQSNDGAPFNAGGPDVTWLPVPSASPCPLSEAWLPSESFPVRTWAPCGPGCLVGDAWPASPADPVASGHLSGGAFIRGEIYLFLSNAGQPQRAAVVRMSDGRTLAAARIDSRDYECTFGGLGNDAPLLFAIAAFGGRDAGAFFGRASVDADAPVQWQSGWIRNGPSIWLSRFMFDDGHGLTSNNGEVDWLSSSSSTAFTILDRTISPVDFASGRGHGLLWNKNNGDHGWIMSFAADAGAPATLFSAPSGTWINVARLTDDRIAWISVSGPRTSEFIYTAARFDWMKYVFDGVSFLTLSEPPGPNIPAYTGLFDLAAGGDYAASIGCDPVADGGNPNDPTCHVYVVQLSTGKLWAIPRRPGGNVFVSVLAVGPNEIILAEQNAMPISVRQWFVRIVRLQTAHLDEIVAAW